MIRACETFEVEARLGRSWPPEEWGPVTVLLAVSGGADSVALFRAMAALKPLSPGRLVVAHFNHGLRGAESARDEAFVVDLCRRWDLPCEVGSAAPREAGAIKPEEATRSERYDFLLDAARCWGARYMATAHTADDQAETVLHHVLRGTGLSGLAGIPRVRLLAPDIVLIRPLLDLGHADLLAYLDRLQQPYCQDGSNLDARFTRNRIRHELLPMLAEDFNGSVVPALGRLSSLAGEAQALIDGLAADLAQRCIIRRDASSVEVDCRPLAGVSRYLIRELLIALWRDQGWPRQAMGFTQWNDLADLALAVKPGAAPIVLPGNIAA